MTKKISENDEDVIIATENKKPKRKPIVSEEDDTDTDDDVLEEEEECDDEDEDDEKKPNTIKESLDHIIGIVSSKKFNLLEDPIMGVVNSKIRDRINERKEQIKTSLAYKG